MKTEGKANVSIFQAYGIGQRDIDGCFVRIVGGRVEIVSGQCQKGMVLGKDRDFNLNLPEGICSISWLA